MSSHLSSQPIGIFDSGIGGLTVAQALVKKLPNENIIYFGDTAHLPYGDKSTAAIQAYSVKITHMLLQQQCKLILIACHTASSAAYDLVKEYAGNKAEVVNVIDPVVKHLHDCYKKKCVGLIGTKATIQSNVYKRKIDDLNLDITLKSQATAILASAIEEGFHHNKVIDSILEEYLSRNTLSDIDALILGCTHYPVIKKNIGRFYNKKVDIIDPSEIVADAVKLRLQSNNLINKNEQGGEKKFYISDYTNTFSDNTKLFFDEAITIAHYPIWD
ncbi:MAG: glutamate racemase [Gammaproteobacteria bacterium CG_4_10_14_0_8_um_filter_38_16]|nr:MAG: glutamate racemase [Gammaproteobacteria bacterium CG_4_10_14_0_8_um_filter_38_16]PJA04130.1 MAG: glutamate racemase [Gammaproteobacteria bacterium CG_4_10_14_0_2_um_filter_38_22]PJB10003.1 MAG: glutamate racemase [Gammaproteobacteria bacterium CG_4_9_14_3_um_filter_38_9]